MYDFLNIIGLLGNWVYGLFCKISLDPIQARQILDHLIIGEFKKGNSFSFSTLGVHYDTISNGLNNNTFIFMIDDFSGYKNLNIHQTKNLNKNKTIIELKTHLLKPKTKKKNVQKCKIHQTYP